MEWLYNGEVVPAKAPQQYGYVYEIEYTTGELYIGKKNFASLLTKEPLKSGEQRPNGVFYNKRKNGKIVKLERVKSESNWRDGYVGSTKKGYALKVKKKTMLQIYTDSVNLTFGELEWMVKLNVLRSDIYLNDNILGKFYKGKII